MRKKENTRRRFAQPSNITPGIFRIVAEIAENSLTSVKEREEFVAAIKKQNVKLSLKKNKENINSK